MTNWIKLSEERPTTDGGYLVIWSNPYQLKAQIKMGWYYGGRFAEEGEVSGANEILYWAYTPLMPDDIAEYREQKMKERGL